MRVERYIGFELSEVLRRINRDLGPNVTIVGTRKLRRRGPLGLVRRAATEVSVVRDGSVATAEEGDAD